MIVVQSYQMKVVQSYQMKVLQIYQMKVLQGYQMKFIQSYQIKVLQSYQMHNTIGRGIGRSFSVGPSGVPALPLGIAAERSIHYIWYYFSSFCATYFSPRRGCPRVMKFSNRKAVKVCALSLGVAGGA